MEKPLIIESIESRTLSSRTRSRCFFAYCTPWKWSLKGEGVDIVFINYENVRSKTFDASER